MSTYFDKQKEGLVKKLFNQEILTRTDVTTAELARIAGVTKQHFYRWYEKFGFKPKENFANDLTDKEIEEKVWNTLTLSQGQKLYQWANAQRFDRKKEPKKRPYTLTKAGRKGRKVNRKRTETDKKRDQATNAKLVKSVMSIEEAPIATQPKNEKVTLSDKLHDFLTTNESTGKQVENLLDVILFNAKPADLTVKSVINSIKKDKLFNAQEWAFQQLFTRSGREAQQDFKDVLTGEKTTADIESSKITIKLFKAFSQNQKYINLNQIK